MKFIAVSAVLISLLFISNSDIYPTELSDPLKGKVLALNPAVDPSQVEQRVGYQTVDGRIVQLILEPSKDMWMLMDNMWMQMFVQSSEKFHVEVKVTDPISKTRIPHSKIQFYAKNITTNATVDKELHPMWGGSGLHYAINHGLFGDGDYEAKITLEVPRFARSMEDKDKWMGTKDTMFYFRIKGDKLTHVSIDSGIEPQGPTTPIPAHDPATLPSTPSTDETFMGEATTENMRLQLILEPSKDMWMYMNDMWMQMGKMNTLFHVEVKPVDETSGTRVSHTDISFTATNTTTSETFTRKLHPMWGGSGLHFAINHSLFGAGDYTATVTANKPVFARAMEDKDKWGNPIQADFTFTIDGNGNVTATEGHPAP